jgi:SAM-dependent methyltransferase
MNYTADELMTKDRWDAIYKEWDTSDVDESMPRIVDIFERENVRRILDFGCGSGRHTIYLAEKGFDVYGIDISKEGVKKTAQKLRDKGLHAILSTGSIYHELPYDADFFDSIISVKVIYHGTIENIRKAIKEMERVLRPKGLIFVTLRKPVPKSQMRPSVKIAPRTYAPVKGRENGVLHYIFNKNLLKKEFRAFKIRDLWVNEGYYFLLGELK